MARREGARGQRILLWLVLVVVFVGYLLWALRAEETFQVISKRLEQTDAGVVVSGEVYNTAASASTVNVEVTFFDDYGHQLSQEVIVLSDLDAGATAAFRTQPKVLPGVKDYTIYINSGRNMYGN